MSTKPGEFQPEITVHTDRETIEESVGAVLNALPRLGYGRDETLRLRAERAKRMLELGHSAKSGRAASTDSGIDR